MDSDHPDLATFITSTLLLILSLILFYFKWAFQYWQRRQVPHQPPIIPYGNYPYFISKEYHIGQVFSKCYQEMKSKGYKYSGFYLTTLPCLILIDPEYIKLIMTKDFNHFHDRSWYHNEKDDPISAHLIAVKGETWRMMRSKMTPAFTSGKIKMMFKILIDCAEVFQKQIQEHCDQGIPLDCKRMFSEYSTDVIGTAAFGLDLDNIRQSNSDFRNYGHKALITTKWKSIMFLLGSAFPKLCRFCGVRVFDKECGDFFIKTVKDTVEFRERTNTIRNDFIQLLINIKNKMRADEKVWTIEELAAQCFIFFLAGFETTSSTIAFAVYELAKHPEFQQRARQEVLETLKQHNGEFTYDAIMEMKYLNQIVEETLRKYSPATYLGRVCTKDYQLPQSDVIIEKGVLVIIPTAGIHKDPSFYPDPEKFDPERFNDENKLTRPQYTWLPFGEGPRNCIGLRFGMLEVKTALSLTLKNFEFSVNAKTVEPLQMNPCSILLEVMDGIFIDFERISS